MLPSFYILKNITLATCITLTVGPGCHDPHHWRIWIQLLDMFRNSVDIWDFRKCLAVHLPTRVGSCFGIPNRFLSTSVEFLLFWKTRSKHTVSGFPVHGRNYQNISESYPRYPKVIMNDHLHKPDKCAYISIVWVVTSETALTLSHTIQSCVFSKDLVGPPWKVRVILWIMNCGVPTIHRVAHTWKK